MDKMQLGKLIIKLRSINNMTQADLAEALGVSISAVSKWETGKNYPDISLFTELKNLFHLSFDDLHHPQETLTSLKEGSFLPVEERIQEKKELQLFMEQHPKNSILIKGLCLGILLLFVYALFATLHWGIPSIQRATKEAMESYSIFDVFSEQTLKDEAIHKEVHEICLVVKQYCNFSEDIWPQEFYKYSRNWWAQNPNADVECLRIVVYTNERAALAKEKTKYMGYSYQYERLKH